MQFFYSFQFAKHIWIYFEAGNSPTMSNFTVQVFEHEISTRVVCINGKHPESISSPAMGRTTRNGKDFAPSKGTQRRFPPKYIEITLITI